MEKVIYALWRDPPYACKVLEQLPLLGGELRPGRRVQIEGDVIGKYARRMLTPYQTGFLIPSSLHAQD